MKKSYTQRKRPSRRKSWSPKTMVWCPRCNKWWMKRVTYTGSTKPVYLCHKCKSVSDNFETSGNFRYCFSDIFDEEDEEVISAKK